LWMYVLTGLFFDVLIMILKRGLHVNHYWAANAFMLSEFLLLSFFYRRKIFKSDRLFYFILLTLSLFFVADTLRRPVFTFNTFGCSIFYITYIGYSFAGMYALLREQKIMFLGSSYFFWANVAIIVYASGSFLLFLFRFYLLNRDIELLRLLWGTFFLPLNILKNIILGIALYKYKDD
jgi:hypothetical protein